MEIPPVKIEVHNESEGIVVKLKNPLVIGNCFPVRDRLTRMLQMYTTRTLFVDLSGVPYADTAGLGMLVEVRAGWRREGRELVVRNPVPRVHKTIRMLQMDRTLAIQIQTP